jgi:hypothetical protein
MNSSARVTMGDLIDAIAKLHVINDKNSPETVIVLKQCSSRKGRYYLRTTEESKAFAEPLRD